MARSRASAKAAGSRFEGIVARFLSAALDDDRIERRAKNGANDRGDVTALRSPHGGRLVAEVKDYGGRLMPGPWMNEAHTEMGNDDAVAAFVVAKRRGTTNPADQWVLMTLGDLAVLLGGKKE